MAYGLRYLLEFDMAYNGPTQTFTFNVLQKNYNGAPTRLLGASKPVLDRYQTDEPKPPIKGRNVEVMYINEGNVPLTAFYAPEDDTFKGQLYWGSQLQFEGYLVQNDCSEILTDAKHEVKLSFTDNLGLLKDVTLDQSYQPGLNDLQTTTENMYQKRTLLDVVKHCIYATSLQLPVNIFTQLKPVSVIGANFFDMISINMETFLVSESKWDTCYNVLTKILTAFECTLVQAYGSWNIIRWGELRYAFPQNRLTGFGYAPNFVQINTQYLDTEAQFGLNTDYVLEYSTQQSIQRPFKLAKETFNYKNPIELLKNQNIKRVGNLLRQYTTGSGSSLQTIKEYANVFWTDGFDWTSGGSAIIPISSYGGEFFTRITEDNTVREIERKLVVKANTNTPIIGLSANVELSQNDKPKLSFTWRTQNNQAGPANVTFHIVLSRNQLPTTPKPSSTDLKYLKKDALGNPTWQNTSGYVVNIPSGDDTANWHTETIEMQELPFDGYLYIFLGQNYNTGGETWYKDINLTVSYLINQSSRIVGHIHNDEQALNIKLTSDETIEVDDSPRNSIAGTLFKGVLSNGYGVRSDFWTRDISGLSESKPLGQIITFEQLFQNRIPRLKIDGAIQGLISNNKLLSVISVLNWLQQPNIWGVFGSMEIDYFNNRVDFTFYEMYQNGEVDSDLTETYSFTYIYDSN